jgi:hypothetical protein
VSLILQRSHFWLIKKERHMTWEFVGQGTRKV